LPTPLSRSGNLLALTAGIAATAATIWYLWPADQTGDDASEVAAAETDSPAMEDSGSYAAHAVSPTAAGYVGSQQCVTCHTEIAGMWQTHPMSRSITRIGQPPPGAAAASPIVPGRVRRYHVQCGDGEMLHREEMLSVEGDEIFSQTMAMDYVVGSGRRAFAYLYQQGELLFQSPVNWYTQTGSWDLAPGYQPDDPRRFRRRVTDDCLSCHAGRVAAVGTLAHRYQDPPFHEMGIGCENCHGPGADHIEFHANQHDTRSSSHTDPIVNPAELSLDRRESVCNQCHLQPAARITRIGRTDLDFRPGQLFSEIWTALEVDVESQSDGLARAVNHVQQMRASVCFTASDQRLGCISCHDPHRVPAESEREQFYRDKCLSCHVTDDCNTDPVLRDSNRDSCITCHMPRNGTSNISHISQTDHRILKHATESKPAATNPDVTIPLRIFGDDRDTLAEWEQHRAIGVGTFAYFNKKGLPVPDEIVQLLESAYAANPEDGLVVSTLAAYFLQRQQPDRARDYFNKALPDPFSRQNALAGRLELSYTQGDWSAAAYYVTQCLALDPGDPGYHALYADILLNTGQLSDAIVAAEKSIALDPTRIAVRKWLADAYDRAGRVADAERMRAVIQQMLEVKPQE
jgi:hypothetical protein